MGKKNYMRAFLLKLVFIFVAFSTRGQIVYNQDAKDCHNCILNLDFEQANLQLSAANASNNAIWYWLHAEYQFVYYLTQSPYQNVDLVISDINQALDQLNKQSQKLAIYYGIMADLYWYQCFIDFQQERYLSTINHFQKAKKQIRILEKLYPNSDENERQQIIYTLVSAQAAKYLGLNYALTDTMKNRIRQLANLQSERNQREMHIIVPYLYNAIYDDTPEAFNWLNARFYQTGPLEVFSYVFVVKKQQRYGDYLSALNYAAVHNFNARLPYLDFLYGLQLTNNLQFSGYEILTKFIQNKPNYPGWYWAYLKIHWYELATGNEKNRVTTNIKSQRALLYADKQAIYEFDNAKNWTPELVRARLLFDGGNFESSLHTLLKAKDKVHYYDKAQRLEYSYRLARAYQMLHHEKLSIKFYRMVIYSGLDAQFYYPAYAAYYCGQLLQQKYPGKASSYYKTCLTLDAPVYKNSIHRKAKHAIEILNQE